MERLTQLKIAEIEPDVSLKEKCFLLGDICHLKATASGIDTALQTTTRRLQEYHSCAHLKAPVGVVSPDVELTLSYALILEGPFSFPKGYRRVSSVLFLCCNSPNQLQKEVIIRLRHWAGICTGKEGALCFMKANHELDSGESQYRFRPVEGGVFDQESGSLHLKGHFCFICTAIDDSKEYNSDRYYAVLCNKGDQEFRICIIYAIPSWIEVSDRKSGL